MAIQQCCDECGKSWPIDNLVLVEYYKKLMCPTCINEIINAAGELMAAIATRKVVKNDCIWGESR